MFCVRRRVAALAVAFALVACGSDGDDGGEPATETTAATPDPDALDAVLADFADDEPGCAAALGVDGEVVWSGAVGAANLDSLTAIDDETVFDIGSTSKQFTATAVLLLADEGELALDDTLGELVLELPEWADEITVDHLLHHQGGIPDYIDLLQEEGYELADQTTVDDALAVIRGSEELMFEPGSQYEYSNSGYFVLSQVVEAATGQTLGDYLTDNVFDPLGLDAVMDATPEIDGAATSYEPDDEGGFAAADSHWEQTGDGAVWTTPAELVRWAPELWDSQLAEGLAEARLAEAIEGEDGERYGGGVVIEEDDDGVTMLSHPGSWSGFVTDLVVVPDETLAAAVSCNRDDADPTDMATQLIAAWRDQ